MTERKVRRATFRRLTIEYDPFGDENGRATVTATFPLPPSDLVAELSVGWFGSSWERWPDNRRVRSGSLHLAGELRPPRVEIPDDDIPF